MCSKTILVSGLFLFAPTRTLAGPPHQHAGVADTGPHPCVPVSSSSGGGGASGMTDTSATERSCTTKDADNDRNQMTDCGGWIIVNENEIHEEDGAIVPASFEKKSKRPLLEKSRGDKKYPLTRCTRCRSCLYSVVRKVVVMVSVLAALVIALIEFVAHQTAGRGPIILTVHAVLDDLVPCFDDKL